MRRPLLLFLFAISAAITVLHYLNPFGLGDILLPRGKPVETGSVQEIEGIVTKVVPKDGYCAITLRCGSEKVLIRMHGEYEIASLYELVGRRASAKGYVELPSERRNPGCFDYRLYLKGRRIFSIMDISRYRFSAGSVRRPILNLLSRKKGQFLETSRRYLSEKDFSIIAGLMFGETTYMDEDLYEEFRLNGIAHVLAVSGLHVGLLYAVVRRLFGKKSSMGNSAAVLSVIFAYAALASFSVSVMRASFMVSLHVLAPHFKRRYDMTSAATLCACVFLLINPYQLFDIGFQLSFAAAYSMGIALPWATSEGIRLSDKYKKKWILHLFEIFSPGFMVQLGMTPLILFHFLTFSPIALLLNPLAVVIAALLLPAGLLCFLVSLAFRGLPLAISCGPAGGFAKLLGLLSSAGNYAGGSWYVCATPIASLILYYAMFFWFFSETRVVLNRRKKYPHLLALSIAIIAGSCTLPIAFGLSEHILPWKYNSHSATFLDVGQGDCTHISIDGFNILIDGGGSSYSNIAKRTLRPYLLKNGISHIDLAIITHDDSDHALGIRQLDEIYPIDRILQLGEDNDDCGIVLIDADGTKLLLMSDADTEREMALIEEYGSELKCDILKVGHHGSAGSTSEELLKACNPSFAIISCGKNNIYGHPADRVIEVLSNSGIIYARTDESGAVFIKGNSYGLLLENASGTAKWHIQTDKNRNTPQEQ